jgi:hypothetical protein
VPSRTSIVIDKIANVLRRLAGFRAGHALFDYGTQSP